MRGNDILRVNGAEDPAAAVVVDAHGPPRGRLVALGSEDADLDIGALALLAGDGVVFYAGNFLLGPAAGDEDAAGSRGRDGLQVDLLLVNDVLVVEGGVFGVDAVDYRLVEGVGGLRVGHGGGCDGATARVVMLDGAGIQDEYYHQTVVFKSQGSSCFL